MRTYELVCAFRVTEGQDVKGIEAVKKIFDKSKAVMKSEEELGDRELTYQIDKETRGRYRLFIVDADPQTLPKMEDSLKLVKEVLTSLFILKNR